jgi:hypothetical protein
MRLYDFGLPEGRRSFIEDYWLHFAAFAYQNYLESGRGAVLLSGSSADDHEMMFITQAQLAGYVDISHNVDVYDPEYQIVVIMALPGLLAVHTQKGDPVPPEAYKFMSRRAKK